MFKSIECVTEKMYLSCIIVTYHWVDNLFYIHSNNLLNYVKISYLSRFRTPAGRNKNSTFFKPEKAVLKFRNICIYICSTDKYFDIGLSFYFNSKCNYLLTVFIGQLFKSSICICSDPANAYLEKITYTSIHNYIYSLKKLIFQASILISSTFNIPIYLF